MKSIAINKAREVHKRHPGLRFPLNMEMLANLEGCECIKWPFLAPVEEVKQGRWIGIAENLSADECRFLISHALAHHLLHCGNQLSFSGGLTVYRKWLEKEADCCAVHILMPENALAEALLEAFPQRSIWEIAEDFGVSEDIVRLRMTEFATDEELYIWKSQSE